MIFFLINFEFASITGAGNTTEDLESGFWFEPTKSSSKRHKSVIHTLANLKPFDPRGLKRVFRSSWDCVMDIHNHHSQTSRLSH